MAVVGQLLVLISGNDALLRASLLRSEAGLKAFGLTAGTTSTMAAASLGAIGLAVAVVAVKAVESASKFEDAMTLIETQAGGTRAEVEAMTTAILKLAPSVATGPQDLADALYRIESTGHRGADALDILTTAARLAKVGHADLEDTTNALLAATNSGIGGFTGMSEAAGILNSIVGSGNMRMEELTAAIGSGFLSTAATFGVTLQSLGASLATMTAAGLPAEESATKLRMTMSLLGAPTNKAIEQLARIGLNSTDLAEAMRGPNGILGAVQMLQDHLEGLSDTDAAALISRAFGGGRSSGAIMALLGLIEQFPIIQEQVIAGAENLDAAWLRTSQDASFRWEQVGVSIDVVVKAIGLALLPVVEKLLGAIVPVVTAFAQWTADNSALAANILLVVGAVGALAVGVLVVNAALALTAVVMSPLLIIAALLIAAVANMDKLVAGASVVQKALGPQGEAQAFRDRFQMEHGRMPSPVEFGQYQAGIAPPMWGDFNTPGFHAGEVGSPYAGPATPAGMAAFGGGMARVRTPIQLNHTTVNQIDGREIGRVVEKTMYDDASQYGSGFTSGALP